MNAYEIYVGDLSRRVGLLAGNGRSPPLSRPGARPAVLSSANLPAFDLFEDE